MADHCCFTSITFKSTSDKPITITVTHADGASVSREFAKKGEEHTVRFGPLKAPVPGGLGRCVTVSIVQPPKAAMTWRLCCDQKGLAKGMPLRHVQDAPGGTTEAFHPADVSDYDVMNPCVDETAGTGTSATGAASSGIVKMEKIKHDGKYRWGAACRLRYVPKHCHKVGFVQGKKRRAQLRRPGHAAFVDIPPEDHDLRLDIEKDAKTPLYPYTVDVPGGAEMTDTPGIDNPWGDADIEDKAAHLGKGAVLRIWWQFKSWVICRDTVPPTILGHFSWRVFVEITIGDGPGDTTGTATPTDPVWSDDPDKDDYNHVVGQTPSHGGDAFRVP